jgi:UDP-N-acetylmuramyl pentapeptide phosphotransferase/UDP-N-acetylglucosamine-1-phosphate transferase
MILTFFFFFNLFLFFFVEIFSRLYGVYDYPDKKRKFQSFPVSLIGGLFIYLNLFIFFILNYFFSLDHEFIYKDNKTLLNLLILSFFFL